MSTQACPPGAHMPPPHGSHLLLTCLQACPPGAHTPDTWLASVTACVCDPLTLRAATPLELARACMTLQSMHGDQQQQAGPGKDAPLGQADNALPMLLMELLSKLQAPGQARVLMAGDVVDVLKVNWVCKNSPQR